MAVAAAVALLLCGVPSAALAESDVVLDNETSNTDVHTGDSTFTNNENTSVTSGVQTDSASSGSSTPGNTTQGLSTTESLSRAVDVPAAVDEASDPGDGQSSQTDTTPEVLFVGFPVSTSIAP
jgi:hypothetical protein